MVALTACLIKAYIFKNRFKTLVFKILFKIFLQFYHIKKLSNQSFQSHYFNFRLGFY